VNATTVPAVIAVPPPASCHAATTNTAAGAAAKKTPTTAQKSRPFTRARVWNCASRSMATLNRRTSSRSRPNTLASRIPETDSVSSAIAVISARDSCTAFHRPSPAAPVRCVSQAKNGTTAIVSTVSCHESTSMATSG
jgi:hypothetical protein